MIHPDSTALPPFAQLRNLAQTLGATAAEIVPALTLRIEEHFAELCAAPHRCPGYGSAPGCPPHAMHPARFRALLHTFSHALVFKIDTPIAALMDSRRLTIARNIHRMAAQLENAALDLGIRGALGLAAGSCKELFCDRELSCVVLTEQQPCRYPDLARGSLSAVGVDFAALARQLGWQYRPIAPESMPDGALEPALMAGLVLLACHEEYRKRPSVTPPADQRDGWCS